MDIDDTVRLNDNEAKGIIKQISECTNATEVQGLDIGKRNEIIKELKKHGLSIRQISRLTGISFNIVRKY